MKYNFIIFGSLFGFLSIALGAFGAHILSSILNSNMMEVFNTAVKYQFFHAIVLLIIEIFKTNLADLKLNKILNTTGNLMIIGIILFSGSLYLYVITNLIFFAFITPFGGLSFLLGWIGFFYFGIKRN